MSKFLEGGDEGTPGEGEAAGAGGDEGMPGEGEAGGEGEETKSEDAPAEM